MLEAAELTAPATARRTSAAAGAGRTFTLRGRGLARWDQSLRVQVGGAECEVQKVHEDGASQWVRQQHAERRRGTHPYCAQLDSSGPDRFVLVCVVDFRVVRDHMGRIGSSA